MVNLRSGTDAVEAAGNALRGEAGGHSEVLSQFVSYMQRMGVKVADSIPVSSASSMMHEVPLFAAGSLEDGRFAVRGMSFGPGGMQLKDDSTWRSSWLVHDTRTGEFVRGDMTNPALSTIERIRLNNGQFESNVSVFDSAGKLRNQFSLNPDRTIVKDGKAFNYFTPTQMANEYPYLHYEPFRKVGLSEVVRRVGDQPEPWIDSKGVEKIANPGDIIIRQPNGGLSSLNADGLKAYEPVAGEPDKLRRKIGSIQEVERPHAFATFEGSDVVLPGNQMLRGETGENYATTKDFVQQAYSAAPGAFGPRLRVMPMHNDLTTMLSHAAITRQSSEAELQRLYPNATIARTPGSAGVPEMLTVSDTANGVPVTMTHMHYDNGKVESTLDYGGVQIKMGGPRLGETGDKYDSRIFGLYTSALDARNNLYKLHQRGLQERLIPSEVRTMRQPPKDLTDSPESVREWAEFETSGIADRHNWESNVSAYAGNLGSIGAKHSRLLYMEPSSGTYKLPHDYESIERGAQYALKMAEGGKPISIQVPGRNGVATHEIHVDTTPGAQYGVVQDGDRYIVTTPIDPRAYKTAVNDILKVSGVGTDDYVAPSRMYF